MDNTELQSTEFHAKIRFLLVLWDMGEGKQKVRKTELPDSALGMRRNAILQALEKDEAIAIEKENRCLVVSFTDKGFQMLTEELNRLDFEFDRTKTQIGTKYANGLLKWYRYQWYRDRESTTIAEVGSTAQTATEAIAQHGANPITSYEEFKSEVLPLFDKLDKGYNYMGLVPIWKLRRELGARVSREEFNDWMMEMQAEKLFYLQSGEARGATEEEKRDSISSEVRGLLFYASQFS